MKLLNLLAHSLRRHLEIHIDTNKSYDDTLSPARNLRRHKMTKYPLMQVPGKGEIFSNMSRTKKNR